MARTYALLTSLKFGSQRWENIAVPTAIARIGAILAAEEEGFVTLKRMNQDQWFAHYFSDLLGGAHPPSAADWNMPRLALDRARRAYDAGDDQQAITALNQAVASFNTLHGKFLVYREALGTGGERARIGLIGTGMVLGAVFSAGVGAAGASLLMGAAASAELTLVEEAAQNVWAREWGVQRDLKIGDIVRNTAASFVSSLISGKLCEMFAAALARSWVKLTFNRMLPAAEQMTFRQIAQWARANGVALPIRGLPKAWESTAREFVVGFEASFGADRFVEIVRFEANKYKGRAMSMLALVEHIAETVAMGMTPVARGPSVARGPAIGRAAVGR